jgi:threonine dehydrogenase-like Zn-dependent dehydrogenase
MKAAYLMNKQIHVGELDDPVPGPGEVLVRTHSCGLCASDLHVKQHGQALSEWSRQYDGPFKMDLSRPMVLGHEYVAEIVDFGPDTQRHLKRGTRVTSQPLAKKSQGFEIIGISNNYPGGFGELMVLSEEYLQPIPDALDADLAAMAEPVCVGLSYVRQARLAKDDVPLVVGCGAIGLSMIMALKFQDQRPIIASDFSPHRRELALAMGADQVVDPRDINPFEAQASLGGRAPNVIFECVGVPGVIDQIIRQCAYSARIIVPGWCLEPDHMLTVCAHTKALNIQFGCGAMTDDFDRAVRALGDGRIDPSRWLGGRISLSEVAARLDGISNPLNPVRFVVDPRLHT